MPNGVLAQQPALFGVGGGVEVHEQPSLEQQDLLVDQRQDTALHEQFPQVRGGPPWLQAVDRLVAQFDVTAAQISWQISGRGGAAVPGGDPGRAGNEPSA